MGKHSVGLAILIAIISVCCVGAGPQAGERTLKLAHGSPPGSVVDNIAHLWSDAVEKNSQMKVLVWPDGTMARSHEIPGLLRRGSVDVGLSRHLATVDLEALTLQFTFNDEEEFLGFARGEIAKRQSNGIAVLAAYIVDVEVMLAQEPINNADSLSGKRLISLGEFSPTVARLLSKQTAALQPLRFSELRGVLRSGELGTNDVASLPLLAFPEAPEFISGAVLTLTDHGYYSAWLGVSQPLYNSLSDNDRQVMREATDAIFGPSLALFLAQRERTLDDRASTSTVIVKPQREALFAAFSPDQNNTPNCTEKEYKKKVQEACKCATGNKADEC